MGMGIPHHILEILCTRSICVFKIDGFFSIFLVIFESRVNRCKGNRKLLSQFCLKKNIVSSVL